MFYPPFGTKQVEIFLFIKRKSAILIFKNRNCAFLFQKIYCEESCKQKSIAEMKKVPQNLHS